MQMSSTNRKITTSNASVSSSESCMHCCLHTPSSSNQSRSCPTAGSEPVELQSSLEGCLDWFEIASNSNRTEMSMDQWIDVHFTNHFADTFVHYWHKTTDGAVHALYWCTDCTELISELILTISNLCQQPTSSATSSLHSAALPCTPLPSIRWILLESLHNQRIIAMNLRNTLQRVPN